MIKLGKAARKQIRTGGDDPLNMLLEVTNREIGQLTDKIINLERKLKEEKRAVKDCRESFLIIAKEVHTVLPITKPV